MASCTGIVGLLLIIRAMLFRLSTGKSGYEESGERMAHPNDTICLRWFNEAFGAISIALCSNSWNGNSMEWMSVFFSVCLSTLI